MTIKSVAARFLVASTVLVLFGVGCGSAGGGGGCAGLRPLPSANNQPDPGPLGLPTDQVIEGGLQARITKPGMDKLLGAITGLVGSSLGNGICVPPVNQNFGITCFNINVGACQNSTCNGGKGCAAGIELTSADGKDKIGIGISEGDNPVVHLDAKFDVHIPLELDYGGELFCANASGSCTLDVASQHHNDASKEPLSITADIQTGIDAATGELTLNLASLQLQNLNLDVSGCSVLGTILNSVISFFNNAVGTAITNFVINLLKPQLNSLIQSFLPKPPGIAGVLDTGSLLASFHPPKDANLEMFVVAGGYIKGKAGGLNLGVMSGANSDRDETTRQPGMTSEPSLCVPVRPTPQLAQAPWNLPYNAGRKDYLLSPANEFSGMPDPTDPMGNTQDVAIGLSRTFLDLIGFHAYNSGTLCLDIGGDAIPQLNAGTLSVIVSSMGNLIEDRMAPLALVLRPQTPIDFTIGAGDMNDPLLHIGISDMRIDFYGWMEERYVRLLTMGVDINVGLNLTVTKTADGKPAIQPMLVGVDAKNVTIRVSNTDLLQEKPDDLAKVFPSLINIATGALGGAVKPIALPAVAGFSLDNLAIQRVQTSQDDFIGIFGSIVTSTPSPLINWNDPEHPELAGSVHAVARLAEVTVPKPRELQALFAERLGVVGARPTVKLALDATGNDGRAVEWAWRIDGGMWRTWTRDPNPVISDDAFLLQGHHKLEVRSRVVNQWSTESQPVALDVLIDSVAPELHPAREEADHSVIDLGGFDLVSKAAKLKYAWRGADGKPTAWTAEPTMPYAEALAVTDGGKQPLVLYAVDEAGNVGQGSFDLGSLGFHGRTTTPSPSGCNCEIGGHDGGAGARGGLLALALMALVFLRRRCKAVAPVLVVVSLAFVAAGCGCDSKNQCRVDDDCAKMMCPAGQVPSCMANECGCTPDVPPGDVGRFSSMTMVGDDAYVAAYNNSYGDLMIGHITPPGVVQGWDYVDGVPDEAPDITNSHSRGGITDKGDDVGRYTSIATSSTNEPIIAYYDKTHGALKFAIFGAIRWHTYVVDSGTGVPDAGGDDIGKWASMTVGPDGMPAIAYSAWVEKGDSGEPESQLRWAQATVPNPTSPSDWQITVVDKRLASDSGAPATDMGAPDMAMGPDMADADAGAPPMMTEPLLPEGIALMASAARKADGSPGIAYYDRTRGNLRLVEWNASTNAWNPPVILDGEDADGNDLGDVGLYDSLTYDEEGTAHISYENASLDHLFYINTATKMPEVVDDGYHPADEQTQDGIDSPVWHLVGDSSSIRRLSGKLMIAYQDSTVLMLRVAVKGDDGKWQKQYVAGHAMPFTGAYGFYADLEVQNGQGVLSSYAINQQMENPLFYVEVFNVNLNIIQ
jgi:MYXO-CTERM domain-containing protein